MNMRVLHMCVHSFQVTCAYKNWIIINNIYLKLPGCIIYTFYTPLVVLVIKGYSLKLQRYRMNYVCKIHGR
jgi:hypothetical protein